MFSTMQREQHGVRKRMMSHVYSKSVIDSSAHLDSNATIIINQRLLPLLDHAARSQQPMDVYELSNALAMDFVTAYLFGTASATNFLQDEGARRRFFAWYHPRRPWDIYTQELPSLVRLCRRLNIPLIPQFVDDANTHIEALILSMCDSADRHFHDPQPGAEPVVYKQLTTAWADAKVKDNLKAQQILQRGDARRLVASDMLDHVGAGHETTGVLLTYLFWEMSRNFEIQTALRDELATLNPPLPFWSSASASGRQQSDLELPSAKALDALPLLHAIIMETLRLHAPIPGQQPRVTPPGGCLLGGVRVPAGVTVSTMAYALHRNPEVFEDPEVWKVGRWLEREKGEGEEGKEGDKEREMMRWFWAFGSGGRGCIGKNLAMREIKLVVAMVYTNYTTTTVDDRDIQATDGYTIRPQSSQLTRFTHV